MTRFRLTFAGLLLAMLLASLDQTIVATALPTIVADLGGLEQLSWVVTAYLVGATVTMPLWGRASDLHGRKPLFLAAIAVFLAGSALSGMAGSLGQLIAFRALQGTGAGGLMTLAMALVADIVNPRERGRYQGYIQMVFVVASVAGPLLGGVFADHLSWRWVFYVNLPIGAAALALTASSLHLPVRRAPARVDYLGGALLAGALTSILLVTTWGGREYAWDAAEIAGLAAVAALLTGAFVARERSAPEPLLPLRLFREPVFVVVSAALFLAMLAFFAVIVFMPIYLQVVEGASAPAATKLFPVTGLGLMAAGLLGLSRIGTGTPLVATGLVLAVFGIGFGMVTQVLTIAIQNAVDRRDLGIATASANLFRALGGAFGVALFGSVFASRLGSDPEHLQGAGASEVASALHTVFLIGAPVALLGLLVVLALREIPLRTA